MARPGIITITGAGEKDLVSPHFVYLPESIYLLERRQAGESVAYPVLSSWRDDEGGGGSILV